MPTACPMSLEVPQSLVTTNVIFPHFPCHCNPPCAALSRLRWSGGYPSIYFFPRKPQKSTVELREKAMKHVVKHLAARAPFRLYPVFCTMPDHVKNAAVPFRQQPHFRVSIRRFLALGLLPSPNGNAHINRHQNQHRHRDNQVHGVRPHTVVKEIQVTIQRIPDGSGDFGWDALGLHFHQRAIQGVIAE